MSRKPKRGYFVKGQFVAEGSELDLQLKAELKGGDAPSKTELKRESDELQKLGEALLTLSAARLDKLDLPSPLIDGLAELKRITNFEGRRRQAQYVGKQMRLLHGNEPGKIDAIRAALDEQHAPSAAETLLLHESERWRDRLLADDNALPEWVTAHPGTDTQALRALIRQARKDSAATAQPPDGAARHGRAYRDLYKLIRGQLQEAQPAADSDDTDNAPAP